ncbi:hypothetical protein VZT92_027986 [Zoarces viviparus]|uniref:Uncharacterized protein n=1 Tax=Zoarces viviparus TaxID=48416 RepID=A0AAW1DRW3_ZOAVI
MDSSGSDLEKDGERDGEEQDGGSTVMIQESGAEGPVEEERQQTTTAAAGGSETSMLQQAEGPEPRAALEEIGSSMDASDAFSGGAGSAPRLFSDPPSDSDFDPRKMQEVRKRLVSSRKNGSEGGKG